MHPSAVPNATTPPEAATTQSVLVMRRQGSEPVTAVIPTYRRGPVLINMIASLVSLAAPPQEILVIDQTEQHDPQSEMTLTDYAARGVVRWLRLKEPSIPGAMNRGLREATQPLVLFLDDDIQPGAVLVHAHTRAHAGAEHAIVAGRVIQPWHADERGPIGGFASTTPGPRDDFMGGNFSVRREWALGLGGFDERFVRVAYRFEAEFAARTRKAGGSIWFEPTAVVHHLKANTGGTRTYGDHLRTASPAHAVGEYYYLLRARPPRWRSQLLTRPWRSVSTRHHVTRPWWIGPTLLAETLGLAWAVSLWARGPKLLGGEA
jgi:GT2 family glycosyltransferase